VCTALGFKDSSDTSTTEHLFCASQQNTRADCTFLRRETMMGPPRCAYYLYHHALAVVFIAAALLFRVVVSANLTSDDESDTGLCTSDWCTSPDGEGGYDCWAGSPTEGCTCEEGKARETGRSIEHEGRTYYGYVCCTTDDGTINGTTTGEHCGDFKGDSKDTKEIEGVIGGIVFVLFAIGLGIGIWAWCCRRRCGGGRNGGGGCCQPKSEYHVGESTTSHNNTRQPMMWSSNVELERTKNDAVVPDAYKTPDNYYR